MSRSRASVRSSRREVRSYPNYRRDGAGRKRRNGQKQTCEPIESRKRQATGTTSKWAVPIHGLRLRSHSNRQNHCVAVLPGQVRFDWQSELKQRARSFLFGACREFTAVPFNNHSANGQPQSHSFRLSRNKSIEDAVHFFRIDPWSSVFKCHGNCIAVVILSCHSQYPTSNFVGVHCFDRIVG
jgi:hypothetical protein